MEELPDSPDTTLPVVTTLTILVPSSIEKLFADTVTEDGLVRREKIDNWIAERRRETRVTRLVEEIHLVPNKESGVVEKVHVRRQLRSSWSKVGVDALTFQNSAARGWRTGSGIQFIMERKEVQGE